MLSRLKKQLNRDNKEASNVSTSLNKNSRTSPNQNEQSGFICPICMSNLNSAEDLQTHFEEMHSSPPPPDPKVSQLPSNEIISTVKQEFNAGHSEELVENKNHSKQLNGAENDAPTVVEHSPINHSTDESVHLGIANVNIMRPTDTTSLQEEVNDLKASLTEEKWYAEELKKELENVKSEKDKVIEECSVLKQQMSIGIETNEELAKQKESLEKKASRMAQSIAELKSINDECISQKEATEERSRNQSAELEKAAAWVRDLESQLIQRPGADDVMVLKKELVSVQTLMDQMTLESEHKGKEVEKERQELQRLLDEAQAQAKLVQEHFDAYKRENTRLKSENEETNAERLESLKKFEEEKEELARVHQEQHNTAQEELKNVESALEKEQSYSKSLEVETNRLQEDKSAMEKDINRLTTEFNNFVQLCDKEKAKNEELSKQNEEIVSAKSQLQNDLKLLQEKLEKAQSEYLVALNEKEARLSAVCMERDDMKCQLDESSDSAAELKRENEALLQESNNLRSTMKQTENDSTATQQQLQIEIAQLKIKQEKLNEDKEQLLDRKSALEENMNALRKSHEEERSLLQARLLDSEREVISFKLKTNQFQDEIGQKSNVLEESRSKIQLLQTSLDEIQNKSHSLNTELALKAQEINSSKEEVEKLSSKLEEEVGRREKATEEANKLREERSHLIAQMEAGEGEAVARAQIAKENEVLRKQNEEAEEKWRKKISEQEQSISDLSSRLKESNLLLTRTQEQLHSHEQALIKLREEVLIEHEKAVQSEAEVKAKVELLSSAEAASATQRADIENHMNTIKRSLEDKTKDLERTNAELVESRRSVDELKSQINKLRQENHVEVANLRNKLDLIEKEKEDALTESQKIREEIERVTKANTLENEKRKQEWKETETKQMERIASLQSELADARSDVIKKTDEQKREESLRAGVEVELNQLKRLLQENEETKKTTQSKLDEVQLALNSANDDIKNLQNEKNDLLVTLEETQNEARQELNLLKLNFEREKQRLQDELAALQEDVKSKELLLNEEKSKCVTLQGAVSDTEAAVNKKSLELEELSKALQTMRLEKVEVEQRLSSDVSGHVESLSNLKIELESARKELEERKEELESKSNKIEELEASANSLKSTAEELTTQLTETEVELENMKTELKDTQLKVSDLQESATSLNGDKSALQAQVEKHQSTVKELEYTVKECERSNEELTADLTTSKKQQEELQKQCDANVEEWNAKETRFHSEIKNLDDLNQQLNVELEEEKVTREQIEAKLQEDLNNLKLQFDEQKVSWQQERQGFQENINSLEAAQSLLVDHKLELKNNVESLQAVIEREKELALSAEEEAIKSAKAKDNVIAAMKSQLEEKNRELETAEADRVVAESRLQLEIGTLSENLNSTRAEWVASTQKVEAMGRDNDDLKGQIVVLNATIQSNTDERRALLERCLDAEQLTEQLNGKLAETRRKLDDAHSAMHELGRENQALQVKHKTTISRQWTDDKSAAGCKACGRAFSLTVRRHHCRHCGDIFCSECSSRSATVAASKNPVRVCERCYDELLTAG